MSAPTVAFGALEHLPGFSTAAEGLTRFQVDGITPAATVEPESTAQVAEIIAWARAQKAALIPVTSGAFLPLGHSPAAADVAVSLRRMNRVTHYDPGDLTLSVEAGATLGEIDALLERDNLWLPADPPGPGRAAVGGLVAANLNGPLRHRFGGWRDCVVGLKFVSGEGKPIRAGGRVVKNVAGYDLTRLLIGSLGSLGVLTEINLRVFPRPAETATFVARFAELDDALTFRDKVVHSVLQPFRVELLSGETAGLLNQASLSGAHWVLLVSCGGRPGVIARHRRDLTQMADAAQADSSTELNGEEERSLWRSVSELLTLARARSPLASCVKCPLPMTQLGPFVEKARLVAGRYGLPVAVQAQAGVAVTYVWYLPETGSEEDAAFRVGQAATETIHAGNNLQGRVTIPWTFPAVKQNVNVWGPLKDDLPLMKKLKDAFDPDRVLNPGRFLGGL